MLRIAYKVVSTRLLYCRREYSLIIKGKDVSFCMV